MPGGLLRPEQLLAVAEAAADLGTPVLELTSRANLQVRGLAPGAEVELGDRLARVGLLPSPTHEKVRNIMASPLGGQRWVAELDAGLCADPGLAGLPGRFLFCLDDGRGDVAWAGADVAALPVGDAVAVLLGGADHGVRVRPGEVVGAVLAAARAFLELRDGQWRVRELGAGVAEIATRLGAGPARVTVTPPVTAGPIGPVGFGDGGAGYAVAVPLGRITREQAAALADRGEVVLTPWRGAVVRGDGSGLADVGLLTSAEDPGIGVTACTGRPGCAKAHADVQAAARGLRVGGRAVHWSGCDRRCGRPAGDVLDVVATEAGYLVDGRAVPGERVVEAATQGREQR
ncbi:Cobalamin biosynthesis protein CobG [Actinokineospora spheciospongiae]|uniref:Cobalamin biosynthesis protein CobG n=1 Tax=Actinokineospora spheciospongiae TaxID=909613 RepID=W7IR27_9PSEU|nr:Cobalamin biosynthesis protein CobG [Actinokineospora spheciospongiae]